MDVLQHSGVEVSLEELRQIRREAHQLAVAPADAVASLFPGIYRALFHGRGIEFDEVRNYQWGDDYRTIDWRVTARTGQMHTKLFHEERERSLYLILNAGHSMRFGTRKRFKWVQAVRIAALFTWLAMETGDRVGAMVYGVGRQPMIQRPSGGEPGAMKVLHLLSGVPSPSVGAVSSLADTLVHLRQLARPGSLILLLSDFSDLDDAATGQLAHLQQHHDLAAIHLYDVLETELPLSGRYPITDGEHESLLDTGDKALRRAYTEQFETQVADLRSRFARYGARMLSMATDEDLVAGLRQALMPGRLQRKPGSPRSLDMKAD